MSDFMLSKFSCTVIDILQMDACTKENYMSRIRLGKMDVNFLVFVLMKVLELTLADKSKVNSMMRLAYTCMCKVNLYIK